MIYIESLFCLLVAKGLGFANAEIPPEASHQSASAPFVTLRVYGNGLGHGHPWGVLIIVVVCLLVIGSLCVFFKRRLFPFLRRKWTHKGSLKDEKFSVRRFHLEELERATNNFSDECLLGSGAFGNVYRGTFEAEGTLAIKRAHSDSFQSVEEFQNEIRLISRVRHRNLVGLVGFCEETGTRRAQMLVYEYVPNGSLLEYMIGRRGRTLTWRQRVNIAIGAAKGLAHLHYEIQPSIIHRDIKPSNILVGEGFEAKVSDFGLVKMGPSEDQSHVSSQIKGTPGYLDPAYCSSCHLSPFSDVYSFGVILLQLVTARPAVDTTRKQPNYHVIGWATRSLESGNIGEVIDVNLLTEPCNMEMMLKMGQLGLRCVVLNPKDRPTMTQVWQELEAALYAADNVITSRDPQKPSRSYQASKNHGSQRSMDSEYSQSFVSIDGVGLQRFHIEMDNDSFKSSSLRCFDVGGVSRDFDGNSLRGISEETLREKDSSRLCP